jgi:hypothetical protein
MQLRKVLSISAVSDTDPSSMIANDRRGNLPALYE